MNEEVNMFNPDKLRELCSDGLVEYVERGFTNTEINPHTDATTVMCHVLEVKNLSRHFWTLLEIWHWLSCRNLS